MRKTSDKLTEQDKQQMCDMYLNNIPISEIAQKMNRWDSTVRYVLKDKGIYVNNTRYFTKEEEENLIADYNNGMIPKKLAEKYNRNSGTIITKLRNLGVYIDSRLNLNKSDWDVIAELYADGEKDKIFSLYPKLSNQSLLVKMSRMQIPYGGKNNWSEYDTKIIQDYYMTTDIYELYEMIEHRHTIESIYSKAANDFGYTKDHKWTEEENEILQKYYSYIPMQDMCDLLPNRTKEAIINHAKIYHLKSMYTTNTFWNDEDTNYLIQNWKDYSDSELSKMLNKDQRSIAGKRSSLGLIRIHQDMTGYESIIKLFRGRTWVWKQLSKESCNYQCVITGSKDFQIHHINNFASICANYFKNHPIKSLKIEDYDQNELEEICNSFVEYHDTFPLGVCIRTDLHKLFHDIYGKQDNNLRQFEQFKNDYNAGLLSIKP